MRMGRVSIAIVALGIVAASCAGSDSEEATPSTSVTTATVAPQTTSTSSTTTTTTPSTTTEAPHAEASATATIASVQSELKLLGYYDGASDGIAGEVTTAAITEFQTDAGIEADGVFGPITDSELAAALQKNEMYVTDVQEHLAELELYTGPIDGDYGKGTTRAIEAFQESCELEATGTLNIATRLCLADL